MRDPIHARHSAVSSCSCGVGDPTTHTLHHQIRRVQRRLRGTIRVKPGDGACAMEANMPNDDAKADPDITVTDELDPADVAVITDGLRAYDLSQTGYYDFRPPPVFVRDPQTGKVVGGLHGRSEFGLVYVAWFF